jgi:hypothetical protein
MVVLVDRAQPTGVEIYDDTDFENYVDWWQETSTSDPATLAEFLDYAMENYPAENYALITKSGHAWCGICPDLDDGVGLKDIDEHDMMPIEGVRAAIESAPDHVDMIVLDGDNMASIEAIYQLRNVVDYFVGSQQDVPIDGMPYKLMIERLVGDEDRGVDGDPEMAPADFACTIIEDYVLYYNNTEGKKVVMDHLLANSAMAVTAAAFSTEKVEEMTDSFMDFISYMMYGVENYEDVDESIELTNWIPTHRPILSSARDFALIGKMADQAGYEWLPDVYSWAQMVGDYVDEDGDLYWGSGADETAFELTRAFMASLDDCRLDLAQCQILDRSGNSFPHGLNIWFPPTWLHWDDLDMTRTRTYAYDGSLIDLPREYYCVDCPLNYSEAGLDFLSDYVGPSIEESQHTELWIQFFDVYYDALWLEYNSGEGQPKPRGTT